MLTYKCRLIRKIVYRMYRDPIRYFTNTSTYPECWDTRCQDNECRLYQEITSIVISKQKSFIACTNGWIILFSSYTSVNVGKINLLVVLLAYKIDIRLSRSCKLICFKFCISK